MRNFTSGFDTEKNKLANEPVNLLKIQWPVITGNPALTLWVSDRDMAIGAITPVHCVSTWAEIDHLLNNGEAAGQSVADSQIEIDNSLHDFGNGPERFSDLVTRYPLEAATATLYQYFGSAALGESDLVPLLIASCEPLEWDESVFIFDMVLISSLYGEEVIGRTISTNEYPNAPEASIGRRMPIIIGTVPKVPAIPVRKAQRTEVSSVALPGDTALDVRDTSKLAASGSVLVGEDTITYTGKTATQLTGCGGIHTAHFADEEVIENISDNRFLVFDKLHPHQSMGTVRVGKEPVTSGFTKDLANGEIIFTDVPRKKIGVDTRFHRGHFDEVAPGNTAINADNALRLDDKGVYAKINENNRKLALKQTTDIGKLGDMDKVKLRVEHFAEEKYANDSVQVRVNGNVVGTLSQPPEDDRADVVGSADDIVPVIDTLNFPLNVATPSISASTTATRTQEQPGSGGTSGQRLKTPTLTDPTAVNSIPVGFPSVPAGVTKAVYSVQITCYQETINSGSPIVSLGGNAVATRTQPVGGLPYVWTYSTSFTISGGSQPTSMNFTMGGGSSSTLIDIHKVSRVLHFNATVSASQGSQATQKQGGVNDVTVNASLNTVTEKSTLGVVDLFDITSIIGGNWGNFINLMVEIEYLGSVDARTVYVIGSEIDTEFHTARYQATDEVYVDVVGLIDDGSGTVTGTPNALIESVPDVFKWSVVAAKGLPGSTIDAASFSAAATAFANVIAGGYKMAGIIQGDETFDDLWRRWSFETRCYFFFDAQGKARLHFRPDNNSLQVEGQEVMTVTQGMIRLPDGAADAIRFSRTPKQEVCNMFTLNYAADYIENAWGADVSLSDAVSIGLYGKREKHPQFDWNLYFCRLAAQAQSVGEFWLSQLRAPSTVVEMELFLTEMELERSDIVKFTHQLGSLSDIFAEVLPGQHVPGSGRDQTMDHIVLRLRLFPIAFLNDTFSEAVDATEIIELVMNFLLTVTDDASVLEDFLTTLKTEFSENAQVMDSIDHIWKYLASESLSVSELLQILDQAVIDEDAVSMGESVLASDGLGYGEQAYGTSPYGGSEVLV